MMITVIIFKSFTGHGFKYNLNSKNIKEKFNRESYYVTILEIRIGFYLAYTGVLYFWKHITNFKIFNSVIVILP